MNEGSGESRGAYARAGVSIDAGNECVSRIIPHVKRTRIPGVLADIGGFGGCFDLKPYGMKDPVLVAGADGVGTKVKVACAMGVHDTIGIDCVAMNVDDIVVQGARPLFFLDYVAVGRLDPATLEAIVKGIADGCQMAGCSLLGGETAEMPGMYRDGEYDIAGFAVGAVERDRLIDGSRIGPGNAVIGVRSSGLHSNGYSLARKVLLEDAGLNLGQRVPELGRTLGEELLEPTRIYARVFVDLFESGAVRVLGLAHITGGGFYENIPRILPAGCRVRINRNAWEPSPVFGLIARLGGIQEREMFRVFNMGIGMVAVVAAEESERAVEFLNSNGFPAGVIGEVVRGETGVDIV